jgi:hypothetical protein
MDFSSGSYQREAEGREKDETTQSSTHPSPSLAPHPARVLSAALLLRAQPSNSSLPEYKGFHSSTKPESLEL